MRHFIPGRQRSFVCKSFRTSRWIVYVNFHAGASFRSRSNEKPCQIDDMSTSCQFSQIQSYNLCCISTGSFRTYVPLQGVIGLRHDFQWRCCKPHPIDDYRNQLQAARRVGWLRLQSVGLRTTQLERRLPLASFRNLSNSLVDRKRLGIHRNVHWYQISLSLFFLWPWKECNRGKMRIVGCSYTYLYTCVLVFIKVNQIKKAIFESFSSYLVRLNPEILATCISPVRV